MIGLLSRFLRTSNGLSSSLLYNEQTFYKAFMRDLSLCKDEAIIESPFITSNRIASLLPIFRKMRSRNIRIVVNTRHPSEHEQPYGDQAWAEIAQMQLIGIEVLFTGSHHRKLAIFDRQILWEGSLNILSQYDSCEIMRRIDSIKLAEHTLSFTKLTHYLK
ncbi:MAG TPA: phospholipase D-like domain-containing protein [Candidatus Saccharimonadales bacterium]